VIVKENEKPKLISEQCWASFGLRPDSTGLAQRLKQPDRPMTPVRREGTGTVTACSASALARSSTVAWSARGGGADDVSTRGLWERHGARFRGGVLTEAMTRRRGGRRRPTRRRSAAMSERSCSSVRARGW
jgi:hypothetical protein